VFVSILTAKGMGKMHIRALVVWFNQLLVVETIVDNLGNPSSCVTEVRPIAEIIADQLRLANHPGTTAMSMKVLLRHKHKWNTNIISLSGTYSILQGFGSSTESTANLDFVIVLNMSPSGGNRVLHPDVCPIPVPMNHMEFLLDPQRSILVHNTHDSLINKEKTTQTKSDLKINECSTAVEETECKPGETLAIAKCESKVGTAVTVSWEVDVKQSKKRFKSHVFHINLETGAFSPIDVFVNLKLGIVIPNRWSIGVIYGSKPQLVKLDCNNIEIERVPMGRLKPVHEDIENDSISESFNSKSSDSKNSRFTFENSNACSVFYWLNLDCIVFASFTYIVVFQAEKLDPILQVEFSGTNNPRQDIQECNIKCSYQNDRHFVLSSGRNLFVLYSPLSNPLAGMCMLSYISLPELLSHAFLEEETISSPSPSSKLVLHVLTSGTSSSYYFKFGIPSNSEKPKLEALACLRGSNTWMLPITRQSIQQNTSLRPSLQPDKNNLILIDSSGILCMTSATKPH
jgi:hypothetical protein